MLTICNATPPDGWCGTGPRCALFGHHADTGHSTRSWFTATTARSRCAGADRRTAAADPGPARSVAAVARAAMKAIFLKTFACF
jgi:hypothetical protein